ncbi:hypothetical protein CCMSSC00406_0003042 [Pleurotus cornucopiae]|nr:hypothetical protein CCMSSC00406_0003042 [Pleurotus cornucopiae]
MIGHNYKKPGKNVKPGDAPNPGGPTWPIAHARRRRPNRCVLQVDFTGPSLVIFLLGLVVVVGIGHNHGYIDRYMWFNVVESSPKPVSDLRDFALVASGATVVGALTSKTYDPKQRRLTPLDKFFLPIELIRTKWAGFDVSKAHLSLPRDAFTDGLIIGRCWEFPGAYGHVGVVLSESIVVTHVSIDHIPRHLLSTSLQNRSPKRIAVWGLVEFPIAMSLPDSRSPYYFSPSASLPPGIPPSDRFVLLADVEYNISSLEHAQFYPIKRPSSPLKIVVFEILSNYGAPTTCLYHAGVHGDPV